MQLHHSITVKNTFCCTLLVVAATFSSTATKSRSHSFATTAFNCGTQQQWSHGRVKTRFSRVSFLLLPKTTSLFALKEKSMNEKSKDGVFLNTVQLLNRNRRKVPVEPIELPGHVAGSNSGKQIGKKSTSMMFQEIMNNRTDFEMAIMSTLAITIPTGVILTLASSVEDAPQLSQETTNFIRDMLSFSTGNDAAVNNLAAEGVELLGDSIEQLEAISLNVFDAAFPTTATDVISIAIGEGIAASIGGLVAVAARSGVKVKDYFQLIVSGKNVQNWSNGTIFSGQGVSMDGFIVEAVADTDYFITRAAAKPLFSGIGLPPFLGVLLASVPSELIKLSARQREQRRREDELLQALLLEEQRKKTKVKSIFNLQSRFQKEVVKPATPDNISKGITPGLANQIDFVEVFADVTKWLEYDVLTNDFNGMITWNDIPVPSGVESAVYGFLAALSSQLWADALYYFSDFGLEENREIARSRSAKDTLTLYATRCFASATLFGVYESARLPISLFITNLLSGGVDGCLGSDDYNLCLETFMVENPASATAEEQARAFFVAIANIISRLNDEFDYGSMNDVNTFIRASAVQFYSLFRQ
jgi:hypothetical protein